MSTTKTTTYSNIWVAMVPSPIEDCDDLVEHHVIAHRMEEVLELYPLALEIKFVATATFVSSVTHVLSIHPDESDE